MTRRIQLLVGLGLSVLLTWLFLRQAHFGRVGAALAGANLAWLLAAVAAVLIGQLQRAWRWHMLLLPLGRVPLRPLLECTLMGWGVTTVLPGRLGEIVRPVLLSRRTQIRASAAIGSVVLERAFDALAMLILLAGYLAFLPPPAVLTDEGQVALDAMRTTGMLLLAGLVAGFTATALAMRSDRFQRGLQQVLDRWLPSRTAAMATGFLAGMSGLKSPWLILGILGHSLMIWSSIVFMYVLLFWAFSIQLAFYAAIPLVAVLVIGVMVPTPGAVGAFHAAAQIGLVGLWAVDNDTAIAFAIVAHAVAFVPHSSIGLILLMREGLSLASVRELGAETAESEPGTGV